VLAGVAVKMGSDLLEPLTKAMNGFTEWATTGDNLIDMLKNVGAVLVGAASGFAAYIIMTKAAAISSFSFAGAIKAMTTALASNPIGLISVAIGFLIVGIIKLIKNWAKVKYATLDFVTSAKIWMMEFALTIDKKIGGAFEKLFRQMAKIPGLGKYFKKLADSRKTNTQAIQDSIVQLKAEQKTSRAAHKAEMAQKKKEIEAEKKKANNAKATNDEIIKNNKKKNDANIKGNKDVEKSLKEILKSYASTANEAMGYVGNVVSSVGDLMQAISNKQIAIMERAYNKQIELLDSQMQAELAAAGLSESTEVEKAEVKLAEAIASGDALSIKEAEDAVTKAEIEEKYRKQKEEAEEVYRKKRAQAEYKAALTGWKLQISMAAAQVPLAILNAIAAGSKFGPWGMAAYAAAAATAAGIQLAAIKESKPVAPTAETGLQNYTVPDTLTNRNDKAAVFASGGETVDITPKGQEPERTTNIDIRIDDAVLFKVINRGFATGKIKMSNRNIGAGVFA
ncbi:MAG: hypothetical protein U9N54_03490, partial [candidate division Zixibacteria bacterium]|nr:hypothetical protein [candidate division Zixibacteria bacterium]